MDAYPGVGFVDASIVVLAEKHRVRKVLTPDRRDFTRFRPRGLDYLELLP
jgi:predicted nucleic acid-binding protein